MARLAQGEVRGGKFAEGRDGLHVRSHVDDILWAAYDEWQRVIDSVFAEFGIREIKSDNSRYCGLQVAQDEKFTVRSAAGGNIEKTEVASYPRDSPSRENAMRARQRGLGRSWVLCHGLHAAVDLSYCIV
eukprot:9203266-Pyramimonas_sp.AAC.1